MDQNTQYPYPDTPAKRRAGMAAFRAQMLRAHETALEAMMATGRLATGHPAMPADLQFQRDAIASIKAAQLKLGEVEGGVA